VKTHFDENPPHPIMMILVQMSLTMIFIFIFQMIIVQDTDEGVWLLIHVRNISLDTLTNQCI
jgi:hypothetical protein